MATKLDIVNQAMSLLGSNLCAQLDPPRQTNERLMALLYPQWLASEIRARNWNFARRLVALQPLSDVSPDPEQPYRYVLPGDCKRPLRRNGDCWTVMGRELWDATSDGLQLLYISLPDDTSLFDDLFVNVLAARLAYQGAEQITQSNQKKKDALSAYEDAVDTASRANAFERFPDDIAADDATFSWIACRDNGLSGLY